MNNKKWKIGDKYCINLWSSGEEIEGTIMDIKDGIYFVIWSDKKTSEEHEIRPSERWLREQEEKERAGKRLDV